MNRKIIYAAVVMSMFFTGCNSLPESREKINLNGMVYDTDNRPAVNYGIYIDGKGMCVSDIGGRFVIEGIKKGVHVLTGKGNGYLDIREEVTVQDKEQILYIRVPSVESRFQKAFSFIEGGSYDMAEECIREVLECDKENRNALFFMSVISYLKGEGEKALEYLKKISEKGGGGCYEDELEKIISENQHH